MNASDNAVSRCWSCHGPVDPGAAFCPTCIAIQPPHAFDPFRTMGLAPGFDIAAVDLEQRYFARQRELHPDRFAANSPREREYASRHTANLNDAFAILRSPVKRAEALLAVAGHATGTGDADTVADKELLLEAMEMREGLAEAGTRSAVDAVVTAQEAKSDACIAALSRAFADGDAAAAARLVLRLTYLQKFAAEARERRGRLTAA